MFWCSDIENPAHRTHHSRRRSGSSWSAGKVLLVRMIQNDSSSQLTAHVGEGEAAVDDAVTEATDNVGVL